ncbi:glycoside hydrolase family 15 protein [Aspergillus fijiensis CBS 313.89]|uniref:glucan 1,4-alpha-glucosidase n=1 Tax=Aspergillus fijiensis CBS 313.89 TaxID=1448319 RepID=A0A8G1VU38_9EURO|nr:putative glucoamylase precursor [Aspergillus fijiensis CBS 313.89]RAK73005.1 putative glucoamylase precursor [Aspergillus fijiensis CBS 313.89]
MWSKHLLLLKAILDTALATSNTETFDAISLAEFIEKETPIAWQGILNNIGADGALAQGAYPGIVVASPSKSDPDYFYTWTRDAGLTIPAITGHLTDLTDDGDKTSIERILQHFVTSQATQQTISNPSGSLADGAGLGEPKFHVNMTEFTEAWGRPQRDGPPLRASALIAYGNHLVAHGQTALARANVWPIVRNDLAYVAEYWNETTFDLWEEVRGSSFFTTAVQHKALVEGQAFAEAVGEPCAGCAAVAPQILCHLQQYWDGAAAAAVISNIPTSGRSGLDANSILAAVHTFDPEASCGAESGGGTFQPCSARALSNHKHVVDSFRSLYKVNQGRGAGTAAAVGRYAEDIYQGGHPWYLTTLAAAEQLYDALYQWDRQGVIEVTAVSAPFFADLIRDIVPESYPRASDEYAAISDAVRRYADGFVAVVQQYTPADGGLAEQFDRTTGQPVSAVDLTWSFAAFLTATARRSGAVPPSWGASAAEPAPATCSATSVRGQYATPAVGSWRVQVHDELK